MSHSIYLKIQEHSIERVNSKDPSGKEYIPASDYNELINWISGQKSCVWSLNKDGYYETECGNAFEFLSGFASENDAKFCQYCGNKIKEKS